jgi:hypothetical protein
VIISDACRSTSTSLKIQSLTGSNIFPTISNRNVNTFLDVFYATKVGAPAYEVKDTAGNWDGIYTKCLLEAYVNPAATMTAEVDGIKVIPNKNLEPYLLSIVPGRAQVADREEYPDASVTSSAYIGRAVDKPTWTCRVIGHTDKGPTTVCTSDLFVRSTIGKIPITINNLAELELRRVGVDLNLTPNVQLASIPPVALQTADREVGFGANQDLLLSARGPNVFPTRTGINVFGTRLRSVLSQSIEIQRLREGNGSNEPAVLQLTPRVHQASVVLEFERGSGTVIAGLQGYVATVVVDKDRVISVSYERAQEGELATTPPNEIVAQLRAAVATAAKFGVFRIDGPPDVRESNAARLADAIRVEKSFDPTLGIYAAYAYAAA